MAAGKIFWAFGPESRWDEALSQSRERRTEHTITDIQVLRQQLAQVRREGVAYDLAEWNAELGAVAAPVFGPDGHVRACLTILVPIERFGAREMVEYAAAVKQIAGELSMHLGGL